MLIGYARCSTERQDRCCCKVELAVPGRRSRRRPTPVALISQASAKAFATITTSGFAHPKANILPWPLRSACIASIPYSVR